MSGPGAPRSLQAVEERLEVGSREVVTGLVRVVKRVHEREQTVDLPLQHETVEVRRVVLDRPVDAPPPVREEGGVTIVPVLEEVLVVRKQLVLREELHITRRRVEQHRPQTVTVRSEEIEVTREPPDGTGA